MIHIHFQRQSRAQLRLLKMKSEILFSSFAWFFTILFRVRFFLKFPLKIHFETGISIQGYAIFYFFWVRYVHFIHFTLYHILWTLIFPDDHSRVALSGEEDYINASLVEVPEACRKYILTQVFCSFHISSHFNQNVVFIFDYFFEFRRKIEYP